MSDTFDYEPEPSNFSRHNHDELDGEHPSWNKYGKEWTTKDGQCLHPFEMSESHLKNTINMLERNGFEVPYEMKRELYLRRKQND